MLKGPEPRLETNRPVSVQRFPGRHLHSGHRQEVLILLSAALLLPGGARGNSFWEIMNWPVPGELGTYHFPTIFFSVLYKGVRSHPSAQNFAVVPPKQNKQTNKHWLHFPNNSKRAFCISIPTVQLRTLRHREGTYYLNNTVQPVRAQIQPKPSFHTLYDLMIVAKIKKNFSGPLILLRSLDLERKLDKPS